MVQRFWLILIVQLFLMTGSQSSEHEKNLLKEVLTNYNKDMRPVLEDSHKVTVTIGLSLNQIMDVDEKNQIMTVSVWARMKWKNPYLTWNSSQFGNLTSINIPNKLLWVPDIVLYNNADESVDFRGYLDKLHTRVQIFSNGYNKWLAPVMLRSKCKINVEYFPFDSQICDLKFGSWTYDGFRVDVTNESDQVDLGKYIPSAEWHIKEAPVNRNVLKYFCCPQPYPDVTFHLHIQRRTLFYLTNLILPLIVISVLVTFIFTLPPESGERVSLSITILLAMTVFMLLVTEQIPATSDAVPLVAKFYMAAMFETALALIATCFILRCYHSNANSVPPWMKKFIVGKLAWFFGINKSKALLEEEKEEERQRLKQTIFMERLLESVGTVEHITGLLTSDEDNNTTDASCPHKPQKAVKTESLLSKKDRAMNYISYKILENLELITGNMKNKDKVDRVQEQWHIVALVMDRVAVWTFAILITLTIAIIFYQSPGYVS